MVEQGTHKPLVASSNLAPAIFYPPGGREASLLVGVLVEAEVAVGVAASIVAEANRGIPK